MHEQTSELSTLWTMTVGDHSVAVSSAPEGRVWLEQPGAARRWRAPIDGIAAGYRTDPALGPPRWLLGGRIGGAGAPADIATVVVTASGSFRVEVAVKGPAWLAALPEGAGDWQPVIEFFRPDGTRWGAEFRFPRPLRETLGSDPDASPDGAAATYYAQIAPAPDDSPGAT